MPLALPVVGVRLADYYLSVRAAHASARAARLDPFLARLTPCFDPLAASFALSLDSFAAPFVPPTSGSILERASATMSSRRSPSIAAQRPMRSLVRIPSSRSSTPALGGVPGSFRIAQPPPPP